MMLLDLGVRQFPRPSPRLVHQVHSDTPSLGMVLGQILLMTCFSTVWYAARSVSGLARLRGATQSTQL
ncbi:hypothetical protein ACH4SK_38945 [Streptomyces inhibens]|uniref:hypothetical protein n=1 Tax=Streptomyces inhibens TaxID=2293571 RepID=UPI0037B62CE5